MSVCKELVVKLVVSSITHIRMDTHTEAYNTHFPIRMKNVKIIQLTSVKDYYQIQLLTTNQIGLWSKQRNLG
jgi:hypothetical protein